MQEPWSDCLAPRITTASSQTEFTVASNCIDDQKKSSSQPGSVWIWQHCQLSPETPAMSLVSLETRLAEMKEKYASERELRRRLGGQV